MLHVVIEKNRDSGMYKQTDFVSNFSDVHCANLPLDQSDVFLGLYDDYD